MSALGEVTATCCSASRPSAAVLSLLITAVGAVCNPRSNAASSARLVGVWHCCRGSLVIDIEAGLGTLVRAAKASRSTKIDAMEDAASKR